MRALVGIIFIILMLLMSVVIALATSERSLRILQGGHERHERHERLERLEGLEGFEGHEKFAPYRKLPENIIRASHSIPEAIDYGRLEIAPGIVTIYSSTMPWHIKSLQSALHREFPTAPRTIVDATAHIGADTVNFMRTFPSAEMTSIEINPAIAEITRRNVTREYRRGDRAAPAPRVVCADAADYIRELVDGNSPDLLYLDPPWGNNLRHALMVGSLTAPEAIARALAAGTRAVAIRLPHDSDLDAFESATADCAKKLNLMDVKATRSAICDSRKARSSSCPTRKTGLSLWLLVFRK